MSDAFLKDLLESEELDIKGSVCDLTALFKNIKILDRSTMSSTIQVLASLKNKAKTYQAIKEYSSEVGEDNVFIKIGFDEKGDNSADIERMMYKYLKKLLFECRTPNIMRYIAGFKCNTFLDYLKRRAASRSIPKRAIAYYNGMIERIDELAELEEEFELDGNRATITIIELGKGEQFGDILETGNITEEQFRSVMFQVFYTLREFHLNNVRHNDIHLNNIWVNIHLVPQRLVYFISDDMYATIETNYVVKLYDFDRAAFTTGPISNEILRDNFCPNAGMCENKNERFDLLIVLSRLWEDWGATYPFISDFVLEVVRNSIYFDSDNFIVPGRFCSKRADDTGQVRCSADARIEENGIYNIEQICNDTEFFDPYLHFLSTDGFQTKDIPISQPVKDTEIPLYTFKTNFYVSTACSLSPIAMANKLRRTIK